MFSIEKVRWIFFDIGSTLVDEQAAYDHRLMDMLAGTDLTFDEVCASRIAMAGKGLDGNAAVIAHYGLTKTPWPSQDESLYPDARGVLEYLVNRGYRLGILANQIPGALQRLADWGIAGYFSVCASSAELGVAKPAPEIFEKALAMAGCVPSEAIMVGDRLDNDMVPAKKAGMQTIWIRSGMAAYQPRILGAGCADLILDSLAEITNIFN